MRSSRARVLALAWKDFADVRQQPGLVLPALAMVLGLTLPAFAVMWIGSADAANSPNSDFALAAGSAAGAAPELARMAPAARAQAFLLQQFLLFSLLTPVLGALSLAAQGIIGEKQARTLEPLLVTPITTGELLLGKLIVPLAVAMLLLASTFLVYLIGLAGWGEPGVWATLFWPRTLALYLVIGPLVSAAALLGACIVSSRVNDARTAQQLGSVLVLPITALFVGQLAGQFLLGAGALVAIAVVLALTISVLAWVAVRVFQRETILMRWK